MKSVAKKKYIQSNVLTAEVELLQIIDSLPLSINLGQRIKFSNIMRSCVALEETKQLLETIKRYDYKTYIHSLSVCVYSLGIGQYERLNERELQELALSAILHDIGKATIPTLLLNKAGKFTEVERVEMNKHSFYGYDMLKSTILPSFVADVAYEHHERLDGSGYPRGLFSKDILPYAKIVAIGDVFDALTSERPYKEAMSIKEALELMKLTVGTQFDVEMMKSFYTFIDECIKIKGENKNTMQTKEKVHLGKESYKTDFHYRFEKELCMATDKVSGKAAPCYAKVSIRYDEPIAEEQLKAWHMSRAPLYNPAHVYTEAELLQITPITTETYKAEKQAESSKVRVGDVLGFYL